MKVSILVFLRLTLATFRSHGWILLAAQLPELGAELMADSLTQWVASRSYGLVLLWVGMAWLAITWAPGLTLRTIQNPALRLRDMPNLYWRSLPALLATLQATALVLVLILVGLPLILPAMYFYCVYLCVPFVGFDAPKIPATAKLRRSKIVFRKNWKTLLPLAVCFITLSSLGSVVFDALITHAGNHGAQLLYTGLRIGFTLVTSAIFNATLAHFYLARREDPK